MSKIYFNRKPMPVFPEYRPLYKISQVLLVLCMSSRGGRSSLIRLHLINWSFKKKARQRVLVKSVKDKTINFGVWGIDPSLNYALQYGVAEELLVNTNNGYMITEKGKRFFNNNDLKSIMTSEAELLEEIGYGLTEGMVEEVSKGWG